MQTTRVILLVLLASVMVTTGGADKRVEKRAKAQAGRVFIALKDVTTFTDQEDAVAKTRTLTSPQIPVEIAVNEVIVSWNVEAPKGSGVKVEAQARYGDHTTRWYTLGLWSPDGERFPRESVRGQKDADGNVQTDTLILTQPADAITTRLTLQATPDGSYPKVKFVGISLTDTTGLPPAREPNRSVWGKELSVPGRAQSGWPGANGWCSPTSTSMSLAFWAKQLQRPELDIPVPQAARAMYDRVYDGTGNWPFNTAFAGAFPGMRAYVTRLPDIRALEDWIEAGIPPVVSLSYDLLKGMKRNRDPGHLMVCVGFTKDGDIILNDPAHHPERGETARSIYPRATFLRAWKRSEYTVYLIYPEGASLPSDTYGLWEK